MDNTYDVIIIGAGPAGLSTALYTGRSNLSTLIIEKGAPGGQLLNTDTIENYIGAKSVNAMDLSMSMYEDALAFGAEYTYGNVQSVSRKEDYLEIATSDTTYRGRTVVVATGTEYRKLGIPGEAHFDGRGVSYCATCDGAFFRGKEIAVVGGGDSALESANFLTQFGDVTLVHRRYDYRGEPHLQDLVRSNPKIKEILNSELLEVRSQEGTDAGQKVEQVVVKNKTNDKTSLMDMDGVFVNVGQLPQTTFLDEEILTKDKWVKVDKWYRTDIEGLFAIGDVINKEVRQVANAVGEGAEVAQYIFNYIQTL